MLSIVFNSMDIARTRVAPAADPVWELILSLHRLQGRIWDPLMADWRRSVSRVLRRELADGPLRLLCTLNPPRGYFPDFLTPYASRDGWEAGLDAIRSTPVQLLQRDLSLLAAENVRPPAASALGRGEPETLQHLTDSMRRYRSVAIDPYWTRIEAAIEADRSRRARALLDGGAERLLASLRPAVRWDSGVLRVFDYPMSRTLHLDGRGLLLLPSYFSSRIPVTLLDPELPPILVYPVDRLGGLVPASGEGAGPLPVHGRRGGPEALAALVGRTRAAVLEAASDGCTTGEIARRLRISPAAASQHATVLRNAGLLISQRDRNTVLHTLTRLGRAILEH